MARHGLPALLPELALTLACCVRVCAWQHNGVVFGSGEWSAPSSNEHDAAESLSAAIASGASSIRLAPTWFQDNVSSTGVYRGTGSSSPGAKSTPFGTVADQQLVSIIKQGHAAGVHVMLGPVVDPNWAIATNRRSIYPGAQCLLWRTGKAQQAGFPAAPPPGCTKQHSTFNSTGRGQIGLGFSQHDWDAWFVSYTAMSLVYAKMAETQGVSIYCIGAGLWRALGTAAPDANTPRWRALVGAIRSVYKGKLTVAANALAVVSFADELDFLGFDMYSGLALGAPIAGPEAPVVADLVEAWQPYLARLKNISLTTGKPVVASELGFQSRPRSYMSPAGSTRFNAGDCSVYLKCYSMHDQWVAYQAFYTAFAPAAREGWFLGVFWWMWRADPTAGGVNDNSFTPNGKPAAQAMKAFSEEHGLMRTEPPVPARGAPASGSASVGSSRQKQKKQQQRQRQQVGSATQPPAPVSDWKDKENGIVFGSGEWTSFESPSMKLDSIEAIASLRSAADVGVNSVEFIPTWFFPAGTNLTTMYRGNATSAPIALATDTDDELRAGIAAAKKLGMKTSLSPMFDPDYSRLPWWNSSSGGATGNSPSLAGGGAGRGKWGDGWSRMQVNAWFRDYSQVIVGYAQLAQETKVDAYHVGHELHTLLANSKNEGQWRALIKKVRAVYKGKVAVAFNGNPFFNDVASGGVPWLDALDFIGLDCYWPLFTDLTKLDHFWDVASVEDIVKAWQPIIAEMENITTLVGKSIVCTEIGYQSRNYAWIRGLNNVELDPTDCSAWGECVNLQAQANAYEAIITALYPHSWFGGLYLWLWRSDPTAGGTSDDSYVPQNKPAAAVMKRLFGGGGNTAELTAQ